MASKRRPQTKVSLATRARHKKQLFLPLSSAEADKRVLRFRIALLQAAQGTAQAPDLRCLAETVLMVGLIADVEGSEIDDTVLATSEDCMCRRLACLEISDWRLCDSEERCLRAVINEHDRQLHQTRLHILVKAVERFERLLKSVEIPEKMFEARRLENLRKT